MYLNQTSNIGWEWVHIYVLPFIILVYQIRAFIYYIPKFPMKFCCDIIVSQDTQQHDHNCRTQWVILMCTCSTYVSDNDIILSYTRQLTVLTRSTNNYYSTRSDNPCVAEDVISIDYEHSTARITRQFHELAWCVYVIWAFIYRM